MKKRLMIEPDTRLHSALRPLKDERRIIAYDSDGSDLQMKSRPKQPVHVHTFYRAADNDIRTCDAPNKKYFMKTGLEGYFPRKNTHKPSRKPAEKKMKKDTSFRCAIICKVPGHNVRTCLKPGCKRVAARHQML
jgi:hypothetical protein